jgi:ABC-2 type transport system permease protein
VEHRPQRVEIAVEGKGKLLFSHHQPILFIVLFGSVFSGASNSTLTVNYVDLDQSTVSRSFLQAVGHVNGFALKPAASSSVDDEVQKIKDGKMDSLVVIPKGFGQAIASGQHQANIQFYRDVTANTVSGPIESVLNAVANEYQKQHIVSFYWGSDILSMG